MRAVTRFAALLFLLLVSGVTWAQECAGVYSSNAAAKAACDASRAPQGYSSCTGNISYTPGVCGAQYHWRQPNGGPELQFGFMASAGTCPSGYTLSGSSCIPPAPPPECAEMQLVVDGVCTPETPEPAEASSQDIGVTVCAPPTDCSQQANWTPWEESVNVGGWTHAASSPSECFGATTVVCNTNAVYQGAGPATAGTTVGGSSVVGGSYAVTVSCPNGGVVVNNFCEYPAVAGTPTTATAPGTPGTPATVSCGIGYAADGKGGCISAPGATNYVCPPNYTKQADGSCTGAAGSIPGVFGPDAGTGPNAVGSCGGPGQPACAVNVNFDQSIPGAEALATQEGGVSTITAVDVGGPVAACPAPVQLPHGIVWSWSTVCDFASFLRPIVLALAWLAAGMLVLGGKGI